MNKKIKELAGLNCSLGMSTDYNDFVCVWSTGKWMGVYY